MNLISIIIGLVALAAAVLAFTPFLGWANWLIVPIAMLGMVIGIVAEKNTGRNINIAVIVIGIVRLMIGGGII